MNNNNLLPALILSMLILFGFQYLYVKPHQEALRTQAIAQQLQASKQEADKQAVAAGKIVSDTPRARADIVTATPRVTLTTSQFQGSVNLQGARLDDVQLVNYRESVASDAGRVTLLSPAGSAQPVFPTYADVSWLSDQADLVLPTTNTMWQAEKGAKLTPSMPLRLTWDNGHGLQFERVITVDERSMFTLTDTVRNTGKDSVHLFPYGAIARQGNPTARAAGAIHEGGIGVLGGTLEEMKYKKLIDDGKKLYESDGGWLGITDKYWLTALIPAQDEKIDAEFAFSGEGVTDPNQGHFQADFRGAGVTLEPGASTQHMVRLFVGPKSLRQLDLYAEQYNIPHFDRAIDFGWFYFLTKPFLYLLTWLGNAI
ncbi:MAG: membrane protein insertase YidC, partial [Alphaproteobacteria bacterium]|nr:membrane protein insertase YidC [Alphaproteobacteria bacterium]